MVIIGKILGINTSDNQFNLQVTTVDEKNYNLKISTELGKHLQIGQAFEFECEVVYAERTAYHVVSYKSIESLDFEERDMYLRGFYKSSDITAEEAEKIVDSYVAKLDNKIIKEICTTLLKENHDDFYTFPAASKMHHAYVGGLAYHSIGMLSLADGFINSYPYLDKNYIYAGILLHDIGKTVELTGSINTEYTLKGQLLGHLVIGASLIKECAMKLGYENTQECMLLEHMLISHHGQPQFGSAKKPMTAEALALWYIDTIDSKFRVLGDTLMNTEEGTFTENIGVLDRTKIYKPYNS